MKKLSTILCTLALLFGAVGGATSVKAAKLDWSPASPWSGYANCKWTAATNTFSWNGTHNVVRAIQTGFSGDLSAYKYFCATVSNLTGTGVDKLYIKANCTGGSEKTIDLTSGVNVISLADMFANTAEVTTFELWGPSSSDVDCSAVLTDVYVSTEVDQNVNITVGDETRNYQLYIPANAEDNSSLVISLHGAGGASTNYTPFKKEVADAEGCIVAYPQGKNTQLLGNSTTGWTATGEDNFDVDFLKAVIEDVASKYQIDRKRIYCCGFSNGGMMTYAMANACSDEIAAFASISGYPLNEFHLRHTGSRPVPFMHIHGKADDFVLYEKMPTIVDEMVARLGANPMPTTTTGNGYTKNVYAAGDGSFPYVYYEIDGMGHNDYTANTEDGNSAQTMWNFFEQYTLDLQCDETLKWAPRIETAEYNPAEHGWTVNSGTTLLQFGGDQNTGSNGNHNVYHSLQFDNGNYKLSFKSTGSGSIGVKIEKLTSPNTVVLNETINVGTDAELPFEVTDGWGEYKLTITRPSANDAITVTDIKVIQTEATTPVGPRTIVTKTPVLLTGGKISDCLTTGTRIIEMQGWQSFIAYEDAEGVAFDEDSYLQFDIDEAVNNSGVRITFTFSDATTRQEWWCLGIGTSKDDTSTPYGHAFDNSKYWLRKGLNSVWADKSSLKITKVTIDNFGSEDVFTYKVNGGTLCGESLTLKKNNAKTFGAYSGVFTATSAQSNIFKMENFEVGDYQKIVIKFSEAVPSTGGWNLYNNSGLTALADKTEYEFELDGTQISDFTIFNMNANPNPIKISEVYLYKEEEVEVLLAFDEYGVATTDKADLRATGGLSYNPETGGLTTNGKAGTLELKFTNPVNLNYLNKFTVNRSGNDAIIDNVKFYDADDAEINTWNNSKLQNDGLDNNATKAFINHNPVKKLVWSSAAGKSTDLTLTITGITWQLKTISCQNAGETQLNTIPYKKMDGSAQTPTWNVGTVTDTYYGTGTGDAAVSYSDLTNYKELRIYRDDNTGFRAFFINAAGNNVNNINHENTASKWNSEGKYWTIDLSKVEKYDNKIALQGIKSASWGTNNVVNNIIACYEPADNEPKYKLAGSGMQLAETVAALADATATSIDATGVTALTTDQNYAAGKIELTSANPNCLFLATANQLSNTQNVIVNGTCASLVLTDGYPFLAPSDFTATAATYTTTISPAAQAGTLCLPYAAAIPEGVTAYTLTYQSGDNATATEVETTIPANTPVLLNGSGEVTFTGSGAVSASATNVSGALKGVFEAGTVPEGSYVLQKKDNKLAFFKVGSTTINIKPFRAYLTAQAGARLGITFADETTGIETLDNLTISPVDHSVYNLKGQRIGLPTKGLYIVNGKKVVIK